jgi:hypothetical protein
MRPFDELAAKARDRKALTFERKSAILELAKHDDPAVLGVLEQLLGEPDAAIRREVIGALGGVRGGRATALLVRLLEDKDSACVRAALAQLGARNDPASAPALERLSKTGDLGIRIEAKRLLANLGLRSGLAHEARRETGPEASVKAPPGPEPPVVEEAPHRPPVPPRPERHKARPEPEAPVVEKAPPPRPPVPPRPERHEAPPSDADEGLPLPPPPPPPPPLTGLSGPWRVRMVGAGRPRSGHLLSAREREAEEQEGCKASAVRTFGLVVVIAVVAFIIGTCVKVLQ